MKRALLFFLTWAVLSSTAHAQYYFNRRETLNSYGCLTTGVVEHNGKFYTAGATLDSTGYIAGPPMQLVQGVNFDVFAQDGTHLHHAVYQRSPVTMSADSTRRLGVFHVPLRRLSDGTFLLVAESVDDSGVTRSALIKLDSMGALVMYKEIDNPAVCVQPVLSRRRFVTHDMVPDGQGGWLMASRATCAYGASDAETPFYLTKLDSNFDVVWHRLYGQGEYKLNLPTRILIESDGYLIVSSLEQITPPGAPFETRTRMTKVDTAGTVLWQWTSTDSLFTYALDVIRTADGGYLLAGAGGKIYYDPPFNGANRTRSRIEKLDSARNTQWFVHTDHAPGYGANAVLRLLPDGDVIVAGIGAYYFDPADTVFGDFGNDTARGTTFGALIRLNPITGAIRWQRRYQVPNDTMYVQVYDMQRTADGGFVMAGVSEDFDFPVEAPHQRAWLVKVDSNGCLDPNSPPCTETPVSIASTPQPKSHSGYAVYPNPATGAFTLSSPAPGEAAVYDAAGRVVLQVSVQAGGNLLALPLSAPPGVYAVRILPNDGSAPQTLRLIRRP